MSDKNHVPEEFRGLHALLHEELPAFPEKGEKTDRSASWGEKGACLWGHADDHSTSACDYRSHAHKQAYVDHEVYHRYETNFLEASIKTSAYRTKAQGMHPAHYTSMLHRPGREEWHVWGPPNNVTRMLTSLAIDPDTKQPVAPSRHQILAFSNFYSDTAPYWNNAHHLIPKKTLENSIKEINKPADMPIFITRSLLQEKYNVNSQTNMMFLAQDLEVAKLLEMPRHITLGHSDGHIHKNKKRKEYFDHRYYNVYVKSRMTTMFQEFKALGDDFDRKKHPKDIAALTREKLYALSRELRSLIFGETKEIREAQAGKPLSAVFGAMLPAKA